MSITLENKKVCKNNGKIHRTLAIASCEQHQIALISVGRKAMATSGVFPLKPRFHS